LKKNKIILSGTRAYL